MKQNTILLILFGVILIYYLCKSTREGVEDAATEASPATPDPEPQKAAEKSPEAVMEAAQKVSDSEDWAKDDTPTDSGGGAGGPPGAAAGAAGAAAGPPGAAGGPPGAAGGPPGAAGGAAGAAGMGMPDDEQKMKLGPELLKKIKDLESEITRLKFQTKRARLQGQNIVAVDKLDMGKLSMDLFNWQKLNKKSNVDVNLILGDHIKNAAKETRVKHVITPNKKEKSCDPVADEKEQQPPVEYKGYPVFTKPEFPSTQKYELPKGAKAGPSMSKPVEKSDVNTGIPKPFNTESYDQKADSGIEKSH